MIRILLVDDNSDDRLLVIHELQKVFSDLHIQEVGSASQLAQALEAGNFDLVITDYQLHWSNGLEVLRAVLSRFPGCPVIMFTSSGNEEIAVEGMKLGLSDYVLKGRRLSRLPIVVQESLEKAKLKKQYSDAVFALRISEERYRIISELTSDLAYAYRLEADGTLIREWITEAFSRITGYTIEEVDYIGGKLSIINPDDRADVLQRQKQLLCGQTDVSEFRIITKSGEVRWLQNFAYPVWDETQGRVTRIYGAARDITERKLSEDALRKHAQELAEANRLKDEFLANLSHELRTPLNSILGWARFLRSRTVEKATASRALETIERNAKNQTQLIEDILDMSRIIQGKLRLNIYPNNLIEIIAAAIESMRPAAEAKAIRLETRLDASVRMFPCDPNRLQQVIWNLLSNAVKFTPEKGLIEVQLERVDSSVIIKVSDTGIGISADFLPYVFDRFRQADSSTTKSHSGLGLGLAIVRQLVELHGGTVEVESPGIGCGATFTVKLPLLVEPKQSSYG